MNDVQQLVYLEAAIKESLRLNPVAPLIGRTATQDVVFSDGMFIPSGTRVIIPTFAVARLQSIWGKMLLNSSLSAGLTLTRES